MTGKRIGKQGSEKGTVRPTANSTDGMNTEWSRKVSSADRLNMER